jgi:hypothetical protein
MRYMVYDALGSSTMNMHMWMCLSLDFLDLDYMLIWFYSLEC